MVDPKDKRGTEGEPNSPPAVPAIPRLTPAIPEPVGPDPSGPRAPIAGAGRPPSSYTPSQVSPVPKVAPLVPPVPPVSAGAPQRKTGSFPAVPAVPPVGPASTPAPQPKTGSFPAVPAVPPVGPASGPAPQRKTGSFPAVPAVPPVGPASGPAPQRKTGSFPAVPPQPPVARATPVPSVAPVLPKADAAVPPALPSASGAEPEERAELERRFAVLEQLDYFEVMGLESTASPADIKRAFHHQSRTYHPDRFFQSTDLELRECVHAVYKRVTEAYFVLRDDSRRKQYVSDISGPERLAKLRFTELAEAEAKAQVKKEVAEQIGTHPKGRQFFQVGLADLEAGRLAAAERNIKLALTYEPTNPLYLQKLEEARAKSYEEYKRSGRGFRIE
jgi:DnaJ domain